MVPETGIEPVRHFWREILSLLCLPISPPGQRSGIVTDRQSVTKGFLPFRSSRAARRSPVFQGVFFTIFPISVRMNPSKL